MQIPTPENFREFDIKRKEVTRLIRNVERTAEKARIEEIEKLKYNPRELWFSKNQLLFINFKFQFL